MGKKDKSRLEGKVVLFLALLFTVSCGRGVEGDKRNESYLPIEGLWYTITTDSLYLEAVFTDSVAWMVGEPFGEIYRKVNYRGDTIVFLDEGSEVNRAAILNRTDSSFVLVSEFETSSYKRVLPEPLNTDELFKLLLGDEAIKAKYYDGLSIRGDHPLIPK